LNLWLPKEKVSVKNCFWEDGRRLKQNEIVCFNDEVNTSFDHVIENINYACDISGAGRACSLLSITMENVGKNRGSITILEPRCSKL